eukprot:4098898-Amphidinium_carterae.1
MGIDANSSLFHFRDSDVAGPCVLRNSEQDHRQVDFGLTLQRLGAAAVSTWDMKGQWATRERAGNRPTQLDYFVVSARLSHRCLEPKIITNRELGVATDHHALTM